MSFAFLLGGYQLASSGFGGLPMGWHFQGEVGSRHFEWTHLRGSYRWFSELGDFGVGRRCDGVGYVPLGQVLY